MLINPLNISSLHMGSQSVQADLADIKAAIRGDFGLAGTFTTKKSVIEAGDIDPEELRSEISITLRKVVGFLDGGDVDAQIREEAKQERRKARSGKARAKASVAEGAGSDSTRSLVDEIKSQLRILVLILKNALSRDFSARKVGEFERQDILDRVFGDFDKAMGVVPRLSTGGVTKPSYLQVTKLRDRPANLVPEDLPKQVSREMVGQKPMFDKAGPKVDKSDVVQAGASATQRRHTERDHFQAKVDVFRRLREMVAAMRADPQFREEMLRLDVDIHGEETYFKRGDGSEFTATRALDKTYNETVDNLWFLESIMNSSKGETSPVEWILEEPLLGLKFFEDVYRTKTGNDDFQARWGGEEWDEAKKQAFMNFVADELLDQQYVLIRFKSGKTLLQEVEAWIETHASSEIRIQATIEITSRRYKRMVQYIQLERGRDLDKDVADNLLSKIEVNVRSFRKGYSDVFKSLRQNMDQSPSLSQPSPATSDSSAPIVAGSAHPELGQEELGMGTDLVDATLDRAPDVASYAIATQPGDEGEGPPAKKARIEARADESKTGN